MKRAPLSRFIRVALPFRTYARLRSRRIVLSEYLRELIHADLKLPPETRP
jgi:hypothetical protein